MPIKKPERDQFVDLTWNDLEEWAGTRIVYRGKNYQRQGRVSDLAVTENNGLVAWVDGTKRYAVKVSMEESGLPDSFCTCPYMFDCKHGVAVVIDYLKRIEENRAIPNASRDDTRLAMLEDFDLDDDLIDEEVLLSEDMREKIDRFVKGKTKAQLIEFINEIAELYPEVAQDIADRRQLTSGHIRTQVARLRREIHEIGDEPGWQNYWQGEGYTPDYSGIKKKLETLLEAGYADEVLTLGQELVSTGIRQISESHDEGETEMEVAACMPVIVKALDQSSLDPVEKLSWALNAELEDQFEVCEAFAGYLQRRHPTSAWSALADRLLARLKDMKPFNAEHGFSSRFERDRLGDWAIHALDRAGRKDESLMLCKSETPKTGNYERLVGRLISDRQYAEAERWIKEGIRTINNKWPGIAAGLRNQLREIRHQQKNWPAIAALQVEDFIRHPSRQAFIECEKAAHQAQVWAEVREYLLLYLEKGELPWKQKNWPLPDSGLEAPATRSKDQYPMVGELIELAILEKKPDQVLLWYDNLQENKYSWYGVNHDEIAAAIEAHAPDRAVAIWKHKAERLIDQVKPKAYLEAGQYLRKAAMVMVKEDKLKEWKRYLKTLRERHARKVRLLEVLESLEDKPIIGKKR